MSLPGHIEAIIKHNPAKKNVHEIQAVGENDEAGSWAKYVTMKIRFHNSFFP